MGRKRKSTNYRQYYKDYYGIDFGDDMVIHHVDFDRTNNNIYNLLLMPKRLHTKYHWYIAMLGGAGTGTINADFRIDESLCTQSQNLRGLADALDEIVNWTRTKHQMDMMKMCGVRWDEIVRDK